MISKVISQNLNFCLADDYYLSDDRFCYTDANSSLFHKSYIDQFDAADKCLSTEHNNCVLHDKQFESNLKNEIEMLQLEAEKSDSLLDRLGWNRPDNFFRELFGYQSLIGNLGHMLSGEQEDEKNIVESGKATDQANQMVELVSSIDSTDGRVKYVEKQEMKSIENFAIVYGLSSQGDSLQEQEGTNIAQENIVSSGMAKVSAIEMEALVSKINKTDAGIKDAEKMQLQSAQSIEIVYDFTAQINQLAGHEQSNHIAKQDVIESGQVKELAKQIESEIEKIDTTDVALELAAESQRDSLNKFLEFVLIEDYLIKSSKIDNLKRICETLFYGAAVAAQPVDALQVLVAIAAEKSAECLDNKYQYDRYGIVSLALESLTEFTKSLLAFDAKNIFVLFADRTGVHVSSAAISSMMFLTSQTNIELPSFMAIDRQKYDSFFKFMTFVPTVILFENFHENNQFMENLVEEAVFSNFNQTHQKNIKVNGSIAEAAEFMGKKFVWETMKKIPEKDSLNFLPNSDFKQSITEGSLHYAYHFAAKVAVNNIAYNKNLEDAIIAGMKWFICYKYWFHEYLINKKHFVGSFFCAKYLGKITTFFKKSFQINDL